MSGKPASRLSDVDACPVPGHSPSSISAGSPDIFINGLPAARVGDPTDCGDSISSGISSIVLNGKPIAHLLSATGHGGVIVTGSGDVLVGTQTYSGQSGFFEHRFDEQFVLRGPSGRPIVNTRYLIRRESGALEEGITDEQGLTHRLAIHPQAESVEIFVETEREKE